MDNLKKCWEELCGHYTTDVMVIRGIYERIVYLYGENHRHYHTISHIDSMVSEIVTSRERLINPNALLFAAYFHDVVYDPKRKDNELKSVEFSEPALGLIFDGLENTSSEAKNKMFELVKEIILATTNHTKAKTGDDDLDFFLDCDLKILGSTQKEYRAYAAQIRKEYEHVPTLVYNYGRTQILKSFIKSERIYRTEFFHDKYEDQARRNIANEIQSL